MQDGFDIAVAVRVAVKAARASANLLGFCASWSKVRAGRCKRAARVWGVKPPAIFHCGPPYPSAWKDFGVGCSHCLNIAEARISEINRNRDSVTWSPSQSIPGLTKVS